MSDNADTSTLGKAFGPHGDLVVEAFSIALNGDELLLNAALKTATIYAGLTTDADLRAEGKAFLDAVQPPGAEPVDSLILCLALAAQMASLAGDKHELVASIISLAVDASHSDVDEAAV